ncbi:Carnosine N-methyltransferase [Gryllus bimaculatus]|nr:Carnosine N-methyltransferase [Gryllus bimaculatus]
MPVRISPLRVSRSPFTTKNDMEAASRLQQQHYQLFKNTRRIHSLQRVTKTETYLAALPANHQALLADYKGHLRDIKTCIERNHRIIQLIIKDVAYMFENVVAPPEPVTVSPMPGVADLEKVQATLKQFVRDWSQEGAAERQACYQPIIDEIIANFPPDQW